MSLLSVDEFDQALAHPAIDINKALITGSVVMQHRFLYGARCCQGARRKQPGILPGLF